ncbi:gephyrin-like molybdotransferase Glp [Actibacterium sp. MT2.3-13A]|uniref:molybdopterin molybdotransferase MoeA n=1 Tax=Actibacterium sp. MT2.3-13A TaxID=2828332 RepID=UPI001BAD0D88|nr:gephyrin-like molybdotransferase Glp [Actibacterium sp. MT2.3-13A]
MAQADFCSAGKTGATLSVDAARLRTIAAVAMMRETEVLPLDRALGRVLAEPPLARVNLPPFDNAAMDGYAVSTRDLTGEGPWRLPVSDRVAAGDTRSITLRPGTAARIFTGAPIPAGADAVIMQERAHRDGDMLIVSEAPRAALNIRRRGEDRRAGEPALPSGHLLTAPRLALLAGTGIALVSAFRKLRVGLFSTGSELQEPGSPLRHGQIYNSNRVMLRALLAQPWIDLTDYGILRDDAGAIRAAIRRAAEANDIVISSGGVSAGEEDHILDALRCEDATLDVLKVAIRPGKPLTVGRVGGALYVGLPGNPYAAAVTFGQIARPALRKAAGLSEMPEPWIPAVAGFDYPRTTGRREYIPVTWDQRDAMGRPVVQRLGRGASASLGPIAMARGIAVIDPDMPHVSAGQPLQVEPLFE